jgi:hypothetical protein
VRRGRKREICDGTSGMEKQKDVNQKNRVGAKRGRRSDANMSCFRKKR